MQKMDCQYVATQRGGVALVFEGHRYNKVRDGKDGTVYWRCSRDRQCPGRAVTVHSRIKKANNKHNHSPDNGMTSAKPLLNSNSLIPTSGSNHQNPLSAFDMTALLRHSANHHNSSSTKQHQDLTEATMVALLGANSSIGNSNAAAAMAAILQQQQKHLLNSNSNCKTNSQVQNSKTNDYFTNHLNGKINNSHQTHDSNKDNQFRDNLLSTGSTNYLSNASSSSASSSPLISHLCSNIQQQQAPSFQNNRNVQHQFHNQNSKPLDLYNQYNSNQSSNQLNQSNQFPFIEQFNSNRNKSPIQNSNSSIDKQPKLSPNSVPNALTYLNNLSNFNNSCNNLNSLASRLGQQQDWLNRMNNQMNNSRNQITNDGQINQLFAQFELERLARMNDNQLNSSNFSVYNGDEVSHKKFKANHHDTKQQDNKMNGLIKNEQLNQNKMQNNNLRDLILNDENKKNSLKNGRIDDCEIDDLDDIQEDHNHETDEKFAESTNDLIKLGRLLNNPSAIFDTLNQLALTNPQMASAFAISLLGQLDQQNSSALADVNSLKQSKKNANSQEVHQGTGNRRQSGLLKSQQQLKPSEPGDSMTKNIDYYSDSSDEDQPLNMAVKNSSQLVKKLRQLMKNLNYVAEPLQAYIIPTQDAHNSEYIANCDKRREFLTKFTGSDGTAIVTNEESLLWTDGRYFEQAERELGEGWKLMKDRQPGTPTRSEYLCKNLQNGSKVGVDAKLMSFSEFNQMHKSLKKNGIELISVTDNLVDLLWTDRPDRFGGSKSIEPLDLKFTGSSWQQKVQDMRQAMQQKEATILVISALDEIAWLFNLRGSAVPYNPVFFAYTILTLDNIYLFLEEDQLSSSARKQLCLDVSNKQQVNKTDDSMTDSPLEFNSDKFRITIRQYSSIFESFKELLVTHTGKVWIDKNSNYALVSLVPKQQHIESINPIRLKKIVKNPIEIECMRNAHIKDAVALCEFFAWLEEEVPKGTQTEISAAEKLFEFRKEQREFIQNSFETISSSGPNGAVIHYKPSESTNRSLNSEEIYLCDSGAQYLDGTTDVTRVLHFGTPTEFERNAFTRVIKGHISLANCIFPVGLKGHCLDILARKSLWESGLDYLHGTGHGVGCYLNVHEGPIGIGPRSNPDDPGLGEGMILSNEPGYYEKDKFGIRIESLVLVTKKETQYNFNNKGYLCFDTITLVPIQTKLLEPSLLTVDEIEWLDNYHQTCREIVGNALKQQGKTAGYKWLMKETEPLG